MSSTIAFLSIFLGLISGPQEIVVDVAATVASVTLMINDEVIAELNGPPWRTVHDFGPSYRPLRLTAVAHDQEGGESGSAEQWLNLPRPPAEVEVLLVTGGKSASGTVPGALESRRETGAVANLAWQSLSGRDPLAVSVFLDGEPIEAPDPHRIELADVSLDRVHVLRVDLEFADDVATSAEVVFGGAYADRVESELTAFTVAVPSSFGRGAPSDRLDGEVRVGGRAIDVEAVEKGPIDLILVRDESAVPLLRKMIQAEARALRRDASLTNVGLDGQLKRILPLPADATLRFLWPVRVGGEQSYRLFPRSQELKPVHGGMFFLSALMELPESLERDRRRDSARRDAQTEPSVLADAVAVAGMSATRRNRRRAVLVILGPSALKESSSEAVGKARDYLQALGVPLIVMSPVAEVAGAGSSPWGEISDISSPARLRKVIGQVWDDLDAQRVVWIRGRHLPQDISVVGGAVRRAGRESE